jgi:hypothetical protein
MNAYRGPPMTLGNVAAGKVRRSCGASIAGVRSSQMAERYVAAMPVVDWGDRFVCSADSNRGSSLWSPEGFDGKSRQEFTSDYWSRWLTLLGNIAAPGLGTDSTV